MEKKTLRIEIQGKEIILETGQVARQAGGAVVLKQGETVVFSTACANDAPTPGTDFFPLRVDYQEKFSAVGKTLSGYIKREGRPSEREILMSRLIDRPLRPMFPEGYFNEVQVLSYVWSYDGIHLPDPLAICCASAALVISDIPLVKPVAAVRVGFVNGNFVINPTSEELKNSKLDLMLAGTDEGVLMIEGHCNFLTEEQVVQAIETGHEAIGKICGALERWGKEIGKEKNRSSILSLSPDLIKQVRALVEKDLNRVLRIENKKEREIGLGSIHEQMMATLCPDGSDEGAIEGAPTAFDVKRAYKEVQASIMREMILNENKRSDGRTSTQIRQITIEQSFLPRSHGSSLFTRGETQALAVCTLGGEGMAQRFENLEGECTQRFYMQYFFPPFSVGEVGKMGAPGRREVGHGKLAERSLLAILPTKEQFPYTIRLESNITESNGSSSMASVCGGCLALMDAGVPIQRPIAGIAMGLILEKDRHLILSDILGIEDALGDMDFKITGDRDGITAFQMDIKVEGITPAIMRAALEQAKEGRIHILEKMLEVCPTFRKQMSAYAPRIETLRVKQNKIATIIGPGGKQIRAIIEETGVQIDISDDGLVSIASSNLEGIEKAKAIIEGLTAEVEIGKTYRGKVTSIVPFGVFVEVLPGKEGLCHISEFDNMRINDLNEVVKQGDVISVKLLDVNERGQMKLSRKATLAKQTS